MRYYVISKRKKAAVSKPDATKTKRKELTLWELIIVMQLLPMQFSLLIRGVDLVSIIKMVLATLILKKMVKAVEIVLTLLLSVSGLADIL